MDIGEMLHIVHDDVDDDGVDGVAAVPDHIYHCQNRHHLQHHLPIPCPILNVSHFSLDNTIDQVVVCAAAVVGVACDACSRL